MKGTLKRAYIWKRLKRIETKKELLEIFMKGYNLESCYGENHEYFIKVFTPWVKQIGIKKNGRKVYLYEDFGSYGVFTCNKKFTNIRVLKEVPRLTVAQEKKIKKTLEKKPGTYIEGSELFTNNKRVQQFFKIVGNIPVTYWMNDKGEIYGIEAV